MTKVYHFTRDLFRSLFARHSGSRSYRIDGPHDRLASKGGDA